MSLPMNVVTWSGAALSIVLLVYLLVWRRWSAVQASAAGALIAIVVAFGLYGATPQGVGVEVAKGVWNSVSIIAVIVPAILIYEVSREVGGFGTIQRELSRLIPDKLLQVIALGWCFSSFLQGPSGFGVPIAVTAPLLIGIGVKPFWAVLVPLMAHAWANTFGTLALAWEALVQQTTLIADATLYWETAFKTGLLTGLLCVIAGSLLCWQYARFAGLRRGWPAVLVVGLIQAGGQLLLTQITPTLSVVIPTTLALGVVFALGRLPRYARSYADGSPMLADVPEGASDKSPLTIHEALLPYYILVGVSVFVLLTPGVNAVLGAWKMSVAFPETSTAYGFVNKAQPVYGSVSWLTHSGFFLVLAAAASCAYFGSKGLIRRDGLVRILGDTACKSVPAAISVALLLTMSKVMTGSGQIEVLARGTAGATGAYYAALAPLVGTLGAFMSSSNVSSNILFGQFQESMAQFTGKSVSSILAAQTSGAAIGTMFSPSKVLLGTTTAGIVGQEGAIIKKLLVVAVVAAALMGLVTALAV
ncbi:L-lactate permease [Rhodoplanes serenus]|uniref:L-lactate permease n=1 Tax=Rhodoplanes serenus TaxID=200615 RepID=A0A3S4DGR1_9BRAD|nr:L-lactate permease [Rhodoplanes serenus]VCU10012.1 L-lactate permease [Rhodoplanes serenus]